MLFHCLCHSHCLPSGVIKETGMNMEEQCTVYKAVVSENRTLISAETPIVYVDDQQQVHTSTLTLYVKIAK